MKKSVVILIALIYVASVALVSFFGLQFKVFEEVVPVERVEITNPGQKHSEQHGDYVVIRPDESGNVRYQIQYRVYPDNASNAVVDLAYEEEDWFSVDENDVFTFTGSGSVKVHVIATDGSNAEDTIMIVAMVPQNT